MYIIDYWIKLINIVIYVIIPLAGGAKQFKPLLIDCHKFVTSKKIRTKKYINALLTRVPVHVGGTYKHSYEEFTGPI